MQISRRQALRGATAAVAAAAVPITVQADDADVHATVAAWHRAYKAHKAVEAWDRAMLAEPGNDHGAVQKEFYARGYGEVVGVWCDTDNKLQTLKPNTIAGAVALMGCPIAVLRDREARRRGEGVPDSCWYVRTDFTFENAYAALERLVGEG